MSSGYNETTTDMAEIIQQKNDAITRQAEREFQCRVENQLTAINDTARQIKAYEKAIADYQKRMAEQKTVLFAMAYEPPVLATLPDEVPKA